MTRRTPLLLIMVLAGGSGLAACGSAGDDNTSAAAREDKAFAGALKFSKCMRGHGIDMPDPQRGTGGGIVLQSRKSPGGRAPEKGLTGGPGSDPKFQAAQKACEKYLEKGGGRAPSPAEQAKQRDAFLGYARCMRSKGINMPDPKFSANGMSMSIGPGARPGSPKFKAADQACHPLLSAVEPKGAKAGGGPVGVQSQAGAAQ